MTVKHCTACEKQLEPTDEGSDTNYQYDNALWIGFHGGYAMFVDNCFPGEEREILKDADFEAVLCHECAHELCDKNPWVKKLLRPWHSHAHRHTYWENEDNVANHEGWDHPTRGIKNGYSSEPE